ncbi:hypothetical protein HanRHA438_Chr10g0439861 [Helianthus annuus]|nr:hypothetical protein HanRHA438_Chr10g0439861 [Helianthus annuus]
MQLFFPVMQFAFELSSRLKVCVCFFSLSTWVHLFVSRIRLRLNAYIFHFSLSLLLCYFDRFDMMWVSLQL